MSADARAEAERLPGDGAFDAYWAESKTYWASIGGTELQARHAFAAGWDARRRWQASRPVTDAAVDAAARAIFEQAKWDDAPGWEWYVERGTLKKAMEDEFAQARAALEAAREVNP